MSVKMNLRIITKNRAADPKIGFLTKSIFKPCGCAAAMPTAWELSLVCNNIICFEPLFKKVFCEKLLFSDLRSRVERGFVWRSGENWPWNAHFRLKGQKVPKILFEKSCWIRQNLVNSISATEGPSLHIEFTIFRKIGWKFDLSLNLCKNLSWN